MGKNVPSLISFDESTAIKGLLIMLIVFGHISMLTTNFETGSFLFIRNWLYSFHAFTFFILPFIYGYKRKGGEDKDSIIDVYPVLNDLKRNVIRLGIPYCWFLIISIILFGIAGKGDINLRGIVYAFLMGEESLLKEYTGFYFLWFLPTMLALMFLKSLWYNSNTAVKSLMLFLSLGIWLIAISKLITLEEMGRHVPFSLSLSLCYLMVGLAARWIIERIQLEKIYPWILLLIILLSFMMYFRSYMVGANTISYYTFFRLCMPVAMFLFIYRLRALLSTSRVLKLLGNYSLQIYLFNVYIINILNVILLHFFQQSRVLGIGVFILSLVICTGLAIMLKKTPLVYRLLFPR